MILLCDNHVVQNRTAMVYALWCRAHCVWAHSILICLGGCDGCSLQTRVTLPIVCLALVLAIVVTPVVGEFRSEHTASTKSPNRGEESGIYSYPIPMVSIGSHGLYARFLSGSCWYSDMGMVSKQVCHVQNKHRCFCFHFVQFPPL
jgi:hypothetical protein